GAPVLAGEKGHRDAAYSGRGLRIAGLRRLGGGLLLPLHEEVRHCGVSGQPAGAEGDRGFGEVAKENRLWDGLCSPVPEKLPGSYARTRVCFGSKASRRP